MVRDLTSVVATPAMMRPCSVVNANTIQYSVFRILMILVTIYRSVFINTKIEELHRFSNLDSFSRNGENKICKYVDTYSCAESPRSYQ